MGKSELILALLDVVRDLVAGNVDVPEARDRLRPLASKAAAPTQPALPGVSTSGGNTTTGDPSAPVKAPAVDSADAVLRVFNHWRERMSKPTAKLTPERSTYVRARLRQGYSVADLCAAIDGCASNDFNMGASRNSPGTVYDELTMILRNGSSVERYRGMVQDATSLVASATPHSARVAKLRDAAQAALKENRHDDYRRLNQELRAVMSGTD